MEGNTEITGVNWYNYMVNTYWPGKCQPLFVLFFTDSFQISRKTNHW